MRLADEVSIQPLAAGDDEPVRSAVHLHGRPSGAVVSGQVLEGAVESDGRYLLFLTDDTPYEELLHLHLLDVQGQLLDSADLGGPYTTGRFTGPRLHGGNRIGFGFIDDKDWEVELLPGPRLRLPLLSEPKGIWRASPLRCHFVLRARPRAAATS
jgi:hypothetical protein